MLIIAELDVQHKDHGSYSNASKKWNEVIGLQQIFHDTEEALLWLDSAHSPLFKSIRT